jgi:hypothetical protein
MLHKIAGGLRMRHCQGLAVAKRRLHPWRLGSEALRSFTIIGVTFRKTARKCTLDDLEGDDPWRPKKNIPLFAKGVDTILSHGKMQILTDAVSWGSKADSCPVWWCVGARVPPVCTSRPKKHRNIAAGDKRPFATYDSQETDHRGVGSCVTRLSHPSPASDCPG